MNNNKTKININKESIVIDFECTKKEEILKHLYELLLKQDLIKSEFYEHLIKRESEFPTGLTTSVMGVAIPHTEPDHVKKDSIALAILKEPVIFKEMTNPDNEVKVRIIFLLALTDATKHLKILQRIINVIKDSSLLEEMLSKNEEELFELINQKINSDIE